jgi:hypothetical protein
VLSTEPRPSTQPEISITVLTVVDRRPVEVEAVISDRALGVDRRGRATVDGDLALSITPEVDVITQPRRSTVSLSDLTAQSTASERDRSNVLTEPVGVRSRSASDRTLLTPLSEPQRNTALTLDGPAGRPSRSTVRHSSPSRRDLALSITPEVETVLSVSTVGRSEVEAVISDRAHRGRRSGRSTQPPRSRSLRRPRSRPSSPRRPST